MFLQSINRAQFASEVTGAKDIVYGVGKQYQQHFSKHRCHADFCGGDKPLSF